MPVTNKHGYCFRSAKTIREKAEALNKNGTDLVLDHEMYAKAVEILMIENLTDLSSTFGWVDFTRLQFF